MLNTILLPLEATVTPVAASGLFQYAWLMIAIPLVVSGILMLSGKIADGWGHLLAVAAVLSSFVIGCLLFVQMLSASEANRSVAVPLWEWIKSGNWSIKFGLQIDQLSILFVLLITGVGSLIHIYSIGYMAHDARRRRFFAYLNLFIAAMLILVLADNYLAVFLGWEGVGLASYLLISFWQHKPSAAAAGKKAFVVNRIGDLGMTMAVMTMLAMFGSSSFVDVNQHAAHLSPVWATLLGLFLLLGASGKSAQFPLQSWLLDAMEGPTPVSALIHAATMVTAGVYLVVRSHEIYAHSTVALTAVMIIGCITLLMGAWIGCAKDDIKKVLAGSTMSQIGYMLMCAGLGPVGAAFAIFHLITHGFFKANMFLGAGSVMHAMNDDVNMRNYGALAKVLPYTYLTFAAGYLAILGIPPFAGFFSKDHIIEAAFEVSPAVGVLAIVGAGITAFYMTRLMIMTFWGKRRWKDGVHPHESPMTMVIPLIVLALLSLVGGLLLNGWIAGWLAPATGAHAPAHGGGMFDVTHWFTPVGLITLGVVVAGVGLSYLVFGRRSIPKVAPKTTNPLVVLGRRDLLAEDINVHVFRDGGRAVVSMVTDLDRLAIDGAVNGTASTAQGLAGLLRKLQNGYVRSYGLGLVCGLILIGVVMILSRWV